MATVIVKISRQYYASSILSILSFYDYSASLHSFVQEPFSRSYFFEGPKLGFRYDVYTDWLYNQLYFDIRKDILFYKNNLVEFKILKDFHEVFDNNKDSTLYNNIKYIEDKYGCTPLQIDFYHVEDEWHFFERNRVGQLQLSKASVLFNKIQFLTEIENTHLYSV